MDLTANIFPNGFSSISIQTEIFKWGFNTCPNTYISSTKISKQLIYDFEDTKTVLIELCDITSVELSGKTDPTAFIKIAGSHINELQLTDVKNQGLLELNDLDIIGKLKILSSDLKKTDFINCRISKAKMVFVNSKVSEIFAAETNFPKTVYDETKLNYFQAQLAFGQLSKAMNAIGDSVKSLEYQSRELYAHYKQLDFFRKSFFFFNLTKFNLWLNWISNDFGRSWGRAALFSFGLGAAFFYFMTVSSSAFRIAWPDTFDWNLVPCYFRFMNPLRFFETEKIYEPLGRIVTLAPRSYVIDFFARVTIAFGFYQVIQAFRRFGKS